MARIPDNRPDDQKGFVLEIVKSLNNPETAKNITKEYLIEASDYMEALKGNNAINQESKNKIYNALFPKVPKHIPVPSYYKRNPNEQRAAINKIRPNFTNPKVMAKKERAELNEIKYYASQLGNNNTHTKIYREILRRVKPSFRLPESARPDMPYEATLPSDEVIKRLFFDIYLGSEAKKQAAYHKFIDIYLTDWVDRVGYTKNGQQYIRTPYANDNKFLTELREYLDDKLKREFDEKPNPRSLEKKSGNSTRQQLIKDLRDRIRKRTGHLFEERYNKYLESDGGRRTHKRKSVKRRKTRRN
jgi:hypothetical protein